MFSFARPEGEITVVSATVVEGLRHNLSSHTTAAGLRSWFITTMQGSRACACQVTIAELGAERMEQTIGNASFRDTAIGTGIAADKMLALTGQLPLVQIANVILPT